MQRSTPDDCSALMVRVRHGEPGAFEQLVEAVEGRVAGFIYQKLGSRSVTEDLTQEVFLRIYRSRSRYEPNASFITWALTIAGNVVRNELRRRYRHPEFARTWAGESEPYCQESQSPESVASHRETMERVRTAIDRLNPRQKTAMVMWHFECRSYSCIAESLNCTSTAVKSLLNRARTSLREQFSPDGPFGENAAEPLSATA